MQRKFDLSRIKATISRVDRRILLVILLCLGVLLVVIGLLLAFQHKKESVFPVTKTLPSAPAPLPVQQPVPNVAAPPAPVTPDQGIAKEEPVSPAPVKKHEKRLAKKKGALAGKKYPPGILMTSRTAWIKKAALPARKKRHPGILMTSRTAQARGKNLKIIS